ncbi:hypothetical protein TRVA0_045S01244 [Trichomonascus vanleenenianus]|uniref:DASH complex subunit DUO1 n=1 Tax=Trichomonascus vanleenenianus TaxID=2268995 RepID=UPI003EC9C947
MSIEPEAPEVNHLSSSLTSLKMSMTETTEALASNSGDRNRILEAELEQVRQVNDVMEGVIESIETAELNLGTVLQTAKNADKLLDMWIKIMSQTEHTQKLLFTPQWQGSTKDDELQHEREIILAQKREQQRLEQERKRKEEELRAKKAQEAAERKKQRDEIMRRRVYGRRATTVPRPAPASSSSSSTSLRTNATASNSATNGTGRLRQPTATTGIKRAANGSRRV